MKIDAYSILILLSVIVVVSYFYNYLSGKLKIPSVLLLIATGIALQFASRAFSLKLPPVQTVLELLGITGLVFIVLEAALDLHLEKSKFPLIWRAFGSALGLLTVTAGSIALLFVYYYGTSFEQALVYAIPLSIISSAIAIPSVSNMGPETREFVIYESTFSDILGIIAFNYILEDHKSGFSALAGFGFDLILILVISVISTVALVFLLSQAKTHVRFFLTFAIIILTYSLSKYLHLPSLILVLCFGLVINNFRLFDFPVVHKFISFKRLGEVSKEMKLMTAETAFIIRTFFFLLFGYSMNLDLLLSKEVVVMGVAIIVLTLVARFVFLRFLLKINSTPLALIAPRGLITVLLFYSIPPERRLDNVSEGVLFIVIVLTSLMMTIGLLINKERPSEQIEDVI